MNVIFAGTPGFAAHHLKALIDSEHAIAAVYTQPDRRAGRGKQLKASEVKSLALAHQLPVMQPTSLRDPQAQQTLKSLHADVMVVVAYGLLLPEAVLSLPRFGCINVHASLLPRWRGAAPIQRAIEAGDCRSGITIMQMDAGLDTGAMLLTRECAISDTDTSAELYDRLGHLGPDALLHTLTLMENGQMEARAQDHTQSCYAHKIHKAEACIDWQQSAEGIARKIRAFHPTPIAFSELDGQRLRIFSARPVAKASSQQQGPTGQLQIVDNHLLVQCGDAQLSLEQVQLPGKKAMSAEDFIHGAGRRFFQCPELPILGQRQVL